MIDTFRFICPYCNTICHSMESLFEPERFTPGDAMLCGYCGEFGVLEPDWKIRRSTHEDLDRWSLENPVGWETYEMLAADYRRRAAERQGG
jgi:hypothetical protein